MTQQEKDELVELALEKALELVPMPEAREFLNGLPIGFAKTVGNLVIDALEPRLVDVQVAPTAVATGSLVGTSIPTHSSAGPRRSLPADVALPEATQ